MAVLVTLLFLPASQGLAPSLHLGHGLPYSWTVSSHSGCAGGQITAAAFSATSGRGGAAENVSSAACPAAAGGRWVESNGYADTALGAVASFHPNHATRWVNASWNLSGSGRVSATGHLQISLCPWQNSSMLYYVSNPATGATSPEYVNASVQSCEYTAIWQIDLTTQVYDSNRGTTVSGGAFYFNMSGAYYDRYIVNYTFLKAGFKNSSTGWVVQQHAFGSPFTSAIALARSVSVAGSWPLGDHLVVTAVATLVVETIVSGVAHGAARADLNLVPTHGHLDLVSLGLA